MTATADSCSPPSSASVSVAPGLSRAPFTVRKQQALVVLLTQQLADAQFRRADRSAAERLWQEVAVLEIDPERVTALLYSGLDLEDRDALRLEDDRWLAAQGQTPRRGWSLRTLHLGRPWLPQRHLSSV